MAATPASEAEFGLPFSAMAWATSKALYAAFMVLRGTMAAFIVAFWMAASRSAFALSLSFGREKASMMAAKALVSSSTKATSSSFMAWPFSAQSENSFQRSSQPLLWAERFATMAPRAAPSAPMYADTEPPPGAGDSEAVSSAKPLRLILTSLSFIATSAGSSIMYSITLSLGSKGLRSSSPMDLTAIFIISSSAIPRDLCCFSR